MNSTSFRVWCSVAVLCMASFTMVASEFAPIGLLTQISSDLHQDPSRVGLTVSLYAWIGAATGLLSSATSRWFDRKTLLVLLMIVLGVSNGLVAISNSFTLLLCARALGAIAHGIFWAIVAATASSMVPSHRTGLATSIVFGGITIATVLGVPLTNFVGHYHGWNMVFIGLAIMSVLSSVLIKIVLPPLPLTTSADAGGLLEVLLRRRDLQVIYLITAFVAAAHFSAYAFIEPYILRISDVSATDVAALLFLFGVSGFLGNLLSASFLDRALKSLVFAALLIMVCSLAALGLSSSTTNICFVSILLSFWGVAISILFTGLQTWVLTIAGPQTTPAAGIHTAVLNGSIGFGVLLSGHVLDIWGVSGAMLLAALLVTPALIFMVVAVGADNNNRSANRNFSE